MGYVAINSAVSAGYIRTYTHVYFSHAKTKQVVLQTRIRNDTEGEGKGRHQLTHDLWLYNSHDSLSIFEPSTRRTDHDPSKSLKEDLSDTAGPRKHKKRDHRSEKSKCNLCATPRAQRPALQGAKLRSGPKEP